MERKRKATVLGLSEKQCKNINACADYLLKYKAHLRQMNIWPQDCR